METDRKTPKPGNKVRQTAVVLGELGEPPESIRVWRKLVAERWPRTPQRGGAAGMNPHEPAPPSRSSAVPGLPGGPELALGCPEDDIPGGLSCISGHVTGV